MKFGVKGLLTPCGKGQWQEGQTGRRRQPRRRVAGRSGHFGRCWGHSHQPSEVEGKDGCDCTLPNPMYLGDRAMGPLSPYLTPDVLTHPSHRLPVDKPLICGCPSCKKIQGSFPVFFTHCSSPDGETFLVSLSMVSVSWSGPAGPQETEH